ncbi:hypothetical protein [Gloeobacter morelensis]|uniref:Type II secretion system protein GspC N-terminal domain-containing protein n=1 Tax=Gloeobacter morelensis MG652769 TaxID=2781736 RepID=A0ABY3PL62_9CYAN|nr:hypothetical protein [Gloeobacter morelensis]UFP94386.1 hypothetical protein ISF26_22020 [Gloeobacter morelensis MG652769]
MMYPWEKPVSSSSEADIGSIEDPSESYPWLKPAASAEALTAFEEESTAARSPDEERLLEQIAANVPVALSRPASVSYSEPDRPNWLPLTGVLLGAILVGALAVWWSRPDPSEPVVLPSGPAPKTPPAGAPSPTGAAQQSPVAVLIEPSPTRPLVEKTLKDGGRTNPFGSALPEAAPPRAPENLSPVPVIRTPPPLPPAPPVLNLVSLAVSASSRAAFIQVTGEGSEPSYHEVTVGDTVAGWRVVEITRERVRLTQGSKKQTLLAQ